MLSHKIYYIMLLHKIYYISYISYDSLTLVTFEKGGGAIFAETAEGFGVVVLQCVQV
jgi:hypothetical protein